MLIYIIIIRNYKGKICGTWINFSWEQGSRVNLVGIYFFGSVINLRTFPSPLGVNWFIVGETSSNPRWCRWMVGRVKCFLQSKLLSKKKVLTPQTCRWIAGMVQLLLFVTTTKNISLKEILGDVDGWME